MHKTTRWTLAGAAGALLLLGCGGMPQREVLAIVVCVVRAHGIVAGPLLPEQARAQRRRRRDDRVRGDGSAARCDRASARGETPPRVA